MSCHEVPRCNLANQGITQIHSGQHVEVFGNVHVVWSALTWKRANLLDEQLQRNIRVWVLCPQRIRSRLGLGLGGGCPKLGNLPANQLAFLGDCDGRAMLARRRSRPVILVPLTAEGDKEWEAYDPARWVPARASNCQLIDSGGHQPSLVGSLLRVNDLLERLS